MTMLTPASAVALGPGTPPKLSSSSRVVAEVLLPFLCVMALPCRAGRLRSW